MPIAAAGELDRWLQDHGATERELIAAIFKKASGKQTVTFNELLETALCHGWVDTRTKSIDDERYAIRFVPRRPGSKLVAHEPGDCATAAARRPYDRRRHRRAASRPLSRVRFLCRAFAQRASSLAMSASRSARRLRATGNRSDHL